MLPSFFTQTIYILRPVYKIERGSEVPDWENATTRTCSQCSVQPAATSLDQDGRILGIKDGLTVYCPYDTDVQSGDRIVYENETYVIDGVPQRSISPSGSISSTQLQIKRWEG